MSSLHAVTVPKWGLSMEEGTIVTWWAKIDDRVKAGDDLADIETTKITNTVEAPLDGVLRRVFGDVGDVLPCGRLLAVIDTANATEAEIEDFVATRKSEEAEAASESVKAPEPQYLDLDDIRLRYFRLGEGGTPIVFLHGFGGDLDNWLFLQTDLAAGHDTIAFDLPGHGNSGKSVGDGSARTLASVIQRALDALDVKRMHLVAHSFGAAVAAQLAALAPDRIASFTAIAPAGVGVEINADYIQGFLSAKRRSDLMKSVSLLFADPSVVTSSMVETLLRAKRLDGAEAALQTIAAANFADGQQVVVEPAIWPALASKLAVVWGDRDAIIPIAHADLFEPSVKRERIEGAGHMPHLERPNEVAAMVRSHVANAA